eukprot:c1812_g1_i1.p1 GENE.c1812_g1_i1~~c1812_g1_i1.p1  ORF type:complete len:369 (+),score=141.31 c1812_g1_i1:43-1107(+)
MKAIVGDATGLLKSVILTPTPGKCEKKFGKQERNHGVKSLCWTSKTEESFLSLYESGEIMEVDKDFLKSKTIRSDCQKAFFVGSIDQTHCIWANETGEIEILEYFSDENQESISKEKFKGGSPSCCADISFDKKSILIGGEENDATIWSFEEKPKKLFEARNVPHNFLNLRLPVYPTVLQFAPNSNTQFIAGSAYHTVRLYDTKVGRRPTIDFEAGENTITSIKWAKNDMEIILGNGIGKLMRYDVRKKGLINCYKGVGGSVRSIAVHPACDIFICASLDRWLYQFDVYSQSKKSSQRVYLKQQLNCVLFSSHIQSTNVTKPEEEIVVKQKKKRVSEPANTSSTSNQNPKRIKH